jgi:HK97 family phage major capsid protein
VGLLRKANAPEPYVLACHPDVRTALEALQDTTGQPVQPPPSTPTFYTSTQVNVGTAYLYAPSQLAIVRRQDATLEVDRSRLFNSDESELRGKMRVGLIAPNPTAIVKLTAGTAA